MSIVNSHTVSPEKAQGLADADVDALFVKVWQRTISVHLGVNDEALFSCFALAQERLGIPFVARRVGGGGIELQDVELLQDRQKIRHFFGSVPCEGEAFGSGTNAPCSKNQTRWHLDQGPLDAETTAGKCL